MTSFVASSSGAGGPPASPGGTSSSPQQQFYNPHANDDNIDGTIFSQMSRIIETERFSIKAHPGKTEAQHEEDFVNMVQQITSPVAREEDSRRLLRGKQPADTTGPDVTLHRPTPYEVWEKRQAASHATGGVGLASGDPDSRKQATSQKKLSQAALDKMISKMHRVNRNKQDEVVRVQNDGLRQELGGYEFKPRINDYSSKLQHEARQGKGVKKLIERIPLDLIKRAEEDAKMRAALEELQSMRDDGKGPLGIPHREGKAQSEKYLRRMGRGSTPVEPGAPRDPKKEKSDQDKQVQDFFNYQHEKERRLEQRRQIVDEIESRSLVFAPTLPPKTIQYHQVTTTLTISPTYHNLTLSLPVTPTPTTTRYPLP